MSKKREAGKKSLHSSVFMVILYINICSIVILSAFNYYVFHHKSGKAYLDSFLSYNQRVTELAFRNIDRQIIQSVLKLPQLYFSPIKENDPILLPQEEDISGSSVHILALAAEMKKIQKSYPYIAGIDIYYEATNTVVTGFDKVHFSVDEELKDEYLPWYDVCRQMDLSQKFLWTRGNAYLLDEPVLIYINRISRYDWNGKDIVLAIYINPESFGEYIDQQGGHLVIATRDNQILYSGAPKDLETGLEEELKKSKEFAESGPEQNMPFPIKGEKEQWMAFHSMSPTSGLNYYYCVNSSQFFKDYDVTKRMFLFNFIMSILFNLVVLLLISYYNYTAYRKRVQTLSREAGILKEDSSKSFDGSLNVLAKEISILHQTVDSARGLLFQSTVRSLILKRKMGENDEKITPYLTRDCSCVILIDLSNQDMESLVVEELQDKYPPGKGDYHVLFTTIDKDGLAAVLIFDTGDWEKVWAAFIRDMDQCWKQYKMVSGKICPVLKDGINLSYKSAVEVARYWYILTQEKYLSYEQIHMETRKESGSHLKLFEAIRKDINNEDLLDLKYRIEILVTSFKNGNYTIEYCSSTLRDLITLLYQVMQRYQLDMWVVFGYDIREYYKRISDIDTFHCWCDNLCETILKSIHERKQSVDVDMKSQILRLVDEHLERDISLDFLAGQLHIRPDAASRMFRQIMGTGYTDYIKTRKLNRALELMAEGKSVKEVAERLGYSSSQYFIKVFKDSYGVTPYQYKKNQEKSEKDF